MSKAAAARLVEEILKVEETSFQSSRSSGPGGQNVNKVNTKVLFKWHIASNQTLAPEVSARLEDAWGNQISKEGYLVIVAEESRSRSTNKRRCLEKLEHMIQEAMFIPTERKATQPSRQAKEKRLVEKKARGDRKAQRRKPDWD